MTYLVQRPFADHQVGTLLTDLVGLNVEYLLSAGFIVDDDTISGDAPARTNTKKSRKD